VIVFYALLFDSSGEMEMGAWARDDLA